MSTITKANITLGGKPRTVVLIGHKKEDAKGAVESKSVDCLHHIHVIDRSGSMGGVVGDMIDQVKQSIQAMSDQDYVSIVWFSGQGQFRTVIKGAKKDEKSMFAILDGLKSTVGATCFSEAMADVSAIVEELGAICPNFNVTLFTDGQPVVWGWTDQQEREKVYSLVKAMGDKVLAVNTVGYGNWYDRDFLVRVAGLTQFGEFVHSSNMSDYLTIFQHNFEKVADLMVEHVEVSAADAEVLYVATKSSRLSASESADQAVVKMSALDKRKNQFFIIFDAGGLGDHFSYNGQNYEVRDVKEAKLKDETLAYLRYTWAYEKYQANDRHAALAALAEAGDKGLVDSHVNAFTYEEVGSHIGALRKAAFSPKKRMLQGECGADYLPPKDAPCVLDLLKALASGKAWYVPAKDYERIGLKVVDNFNLFRKNEERQVLSELSTLVFNKEMLNVSVAFSLNGLVDINPKRAKAVGLDPVLESAIYRNHTVIKDGNLNMKTLTAVVSRSTLNDVQNFLEARVPGGFVRDIDQYIPGEGGRAILGGDGKVEGELYLVAEFDLSALPVINQSYAERLGKAEDLFSEVSGLLALEARQKVVKQFLAEAKANSAAALKESFKEAGWATAGQTKAYTVDQIEVLKEHGVDDKGRYAGVDRKVEKAEDGDFYEARSLEFSLKGYSALPSVKDVLEKCARIKAGDAKAKLNGPGQAMADEIGRLAGLMNLDKLDLAAYRALEAEQTSIQSAAFRSRAALAGAKVAMVLTGGFWSGLVGPDAKGNYVYEKSEPQMVVKTGREKVYFSPTPAKAETPAAV